MVSFFAGPLHAQVQVGQLVPETALGAQFSLTGDNLPGKRIEASLARDGTSHTILPVAIDATKVTLRAPDGLAPASYLLRVKMNDDAPQFVGQLTVISPVKNAPTGPAAHRTYPAASWIKWWRYGLFDFDIVGERPPAKAEELTTADKSVPLHFGDEPLAIKACVNLTKDEPLTDANQPEPCYAMHTPQRLNIHGLPVKTYGGPHLLAIETPKVSPTPGRSESAVSRHE